MAQLLLISDKSLSTRDNRKVGDIVAIFDDGHKFTEAEKSIFTIAQVALTRPEVQALVPRAKEVFKAPTTDWTPLVDMEGKEAWMDSDGSWKEVVERPRYPLAYEDGLFKNRFSEIAANTTTTLIAKKIAEVTKI